MLLSETKDACANEVKRRTDAKRLHSCEADIAQMDQINYLEMDKVNNMRQPELTTLCYIEKDGKYLMMHRVKKDRDINKDKYIGVGGHFEYGESPDDCLKREVMEETGLTLLEYKPRGIVTFIYGDKEKPEERIVEYMHLYTATKFEGELIDCDEGELEWIDKSAVYDLPIWEGDKIFFRLLEERSDYFSLKLVYSETDELIEVDIN